MLGPWQDYKEAVLQAFMKLGFGLRIQGLLCSYFPGTSNVGLTQRSSSCVPFTLSIQLFHMSQVYSTVCAKAVHMVGSVQAGFRAQGTRP